MISVKEYALRKKVTTQAVYKQLRLHANDLNDHIFKVNGKKMLDDHAVEYLDQVSSESPVIVSDQAMKLELEYLRKREAELLNELNQKNNIIIHLQHENRQLIEQKNENKGFLSSFFKKR